MDVGYRWTDIDWMSRSTGGMDVGVKVCASETNQVVVGVKSYE